jgi:hypothetical protein
MFSRSRSGLGGGKGSDQQTTPVKKLQVLRRDCDCDVSPSSRMSQSPSSSIVSAGHSTMTTPDSGGRATQQPLVSMLGVPIAVASDSVVLQALGWKSVVMCRGCRATSVSADPVAAGKDPTVGIRLDTVRKWQYCDATDGPKGQMCWYCARVYISIFKPRGMDWTSLCLLLNLLTGYEFCVFVHQLDQALPALLSTRCASRD